MVDVILKKLRRQNKHIFRQFLLVIHLGGELQCISVPGFSCDDQPSGDQSQQLTRIDIVRGERADRMNRRRTQDKTTVKSHRDRPSLVVHRLLLSSGYAREEVIPARIFRVAG